MARAPARPLARALACAIALGVALSAAACEVLVPGDLPPYACRGDDPTTCPAGQYCDGASCRPCDALHCPGNPDAGGDVSTQETGGGDAAAPDQDTGGDGTMGQDGPLGDAPPGDGGQCNAGQLGCPCSASSQCASHICGDASVLSSAFTQNAGSVCTQTCCTSADCPGGFVCYGAGTGGSYCVAASALSRPSVPNGAAAGAACSAPSDCRSGSCSGGYCEDTCCAGSQCASPTTCALTAGVDQHASFVCVVHAGAADRASCASPSTCASGVCSYQTCRPHCCGIPSAMTAGYHSCALDVTGSDAYAYADYPSSDPTGGAFGASCTTDDQCKSRACNTATSTCSDLCCVDSDCAGYGGSYVCRPDQMGPSPLTTKHLLCVMGP
jgi:hypothetical protein